MAGGQDNAGRGPYRFVFRVDFESEERREAYEQVWRETSEIIQTYPGARGTRLHKVLGANAVFAVAEWEDKAARDAAFAAIRQDYPESADRILGENGFDDQFGTVTMVFHGDETDIVLPPGV